MGEHAHVRNVITRALGQMPREAPRQPGDGHPAALATCGTDCVASWRRCLTQYGLEPHRVAPASVLTRRELSESRQPIDDLIAIAVAELRRMFDHLVGSDYIVMLTDANGVTVNTHLDASLREEARSSRSVLGSVWTEESQGTNGIGTCLKEGTPLSIVMTDHFGIGLLGLSCTAVPILDAAGGLVGVLDVTTPRPTDHSTQRLVRRIVVLSAKRIENLYVPRQYPGQRVLRLSCHADFVDLANEARIVLDDDDRVVAATPSAAGLLDGSRESLLRRKLTDILPLAAVPDCELPSQVIRTRSAQRDLYLMGCAPDRGLRRRPGTRQAAAKSATHPLDIPLQRASRLLAQGVPILLAGETGTGKTATARALHKSGPRSDHPFIAVNCGAISETLIEAELFGYRHGAFTGASREGAPGLVRQADRGTLFLDEIGELPLSLQTRILHVLSEGEVTPLGGGRSVIVDIAVISATVHDLARRVREGKFREDLYFRLAGMTLTLPALRSRSDRDALVAAMFVEEADRAGRRDLTLSDAARLALLAHSWPGNLRELRHALRYGIALAEGDALLADDLPPSLRPEPAAPPLDRRRLEDALGAAAWNVSAAARTLGVSRATLHRKIAAWSLVRPAGGLRRT